MHDLSLKGIPTPEVIERVDKVKKEIIECVRKPWKFLTLNKYKLSVTLFFVPLDVTDSAIEIGNFVKNVTRSYIWGVITEYVVGYDMAYRLRIQDMFNEMIFDEETYENPRKELKRLWKIYERREQMISTYMIPKSRKVFNLLYFLLLFPKYKKRFVNALREMDQDKIQWTREDKEWIKVRRDYLFYV